MSAVWQRLSRASIIRDLYTMSFVKTALFNCPRGTAAQKEMGTTVALSEIEPGDILFFTDKDSETGEMIDFAGIYTGNGELIYSPYPGEKVKFADLNSSYWQNCFSRAVSFKTDYDIVLHIKLQECRLLCRRCFCIFWGITAKRIDFVTFL